MILRYKQTHLRESYCIGEGNNTEPTFDNDSKKKIFQCYNRAVNTYRTCVIVDLIKEKLIDEVDWSHLRRPDYLDAKDTPTLTKYERITGNTFESIKETYENLVSMYPKKSEFELEYEFEDKNGSIDYNIYYDKNPYKFSYINIVNESKFDEFDNKHMHITEKTLLPFYYFQLPLFLVIQNHVKFISRQSIWREVFLINVNRNKWILRKDIKCYLKKFKDCIK